MFGVAHALRRTAPLVLASLLGCSESTSAGGPGADAGADVGAENDAGEPYVWPEERLIDFVEPLVGTGGDGFGTGAMNPGPTVPFGLVKLGPDTGNDASQTTFTNNSGYYYPNTHLWGFSHTRFNGMGVPEYGAVQVMPTLGMSEGKTAVAGARSLFSHDEEEARPCYYAVRLLDTDIGVELTASAYVGYHRYAFPAASADHTIVVNLAYNPGGRRATATTVHIEPGERAIWGSTTVNGSYSSRFGGLPTYFYAVFEQEFSAWGVWGDDAVPQASATDAAGVAAGGWVTMSAGNGPVVARVALSYVSVDQARVNLGASPFSFDDARTACEAAWQEELSRVRVAGGSDTDRRVFYTSLYHSFFAPTLFSEAGGFYRGFDQQVHQTDGREYFSDFSLWDTYRTVHPLFNWVQRDRHADMMQSLVEMAKLGGELPKWPLGIGYTNGMVGTSADIVLADAVLKDITGFEMDVAWEAAFRHANQTVANDDRDGLTSYLDRGYVASDENGDSVSMTLEYAYDDAALARWARLRGLESEAAALEERSGNYRNLWSEEVGFLVGRRADGTFETDGFSPLSHSDVYTEGNAWHYLWFVPWDAPGLAALMGGSARFVGRLTSYFDLSVQHLTNNTIGRLLPFPYYWHSNEPAIHDSYLFIEAGEPALAQRWVRWVLENNYGLGPDGIPGNDDGGTMSAWAVWTMIGVYPVPGTDRYWVTTPTFDRVEVNLGDRENRERSVTVIAHGTGAYIAAAELDGAPLERAWLEWGDVRDGAVLEVTRSEESTDWGR